MADVEEHHAQLRAWAKGIHGLEAATELLIRGFDGRFADPGCPWVHPTESGHWVDFDSIPALMPPSANTRVLAAAATRCSRGEGPGIPAQRPVRRSSAKATRATQRRPSTPPRT